MYQPLVEFYYKHRCPACKAVNWTYHSHSLRSDPIYNPEKCQCHACSQSYWLMSEEDVKDAYPMDADDTETIEDMYGIDEDEGRAAP